MSALTKPRRDPDEVRLERIEAAVASTLRDREECLHRDPTNWCNRDVSYAQLFAFHSQLADKYNFESGEPNPFEGRNQWLLVSAVLVLLLGIRFHYWRHERLSMNGLT
jgi:hypothetical protein